MGSLSVAFHVVIKGTTPLTVMLWAMALGVERPSRRTPVAILLIVCGLGLVACDRLTLPDRPYGHPGLTQIVPALTHCTPCAHSL